MYLENQAKSVKAKLAKLYFMIVIYKAQNKINGKIYIGKTNNLPKRIREHTRYDVHNGLLFHKAIECYGEENFEWTIIDRCETNEEANRFEMYYIKKYDSFKPNGYNMTTGGDGNSNQSAKRIVCLSLNGDYIKTYNSAAEAEREDGFTNSTVLICCKNPQRTCKGHIFMYEEDYLKNGAIIYQKPKSVRCKKVIQCDLNGNYIGEYESVTEAAEKTKSSRTAILGCANGYYKKANGYIWVYEKDFPIKDIESYKDKKKGRKIAQVDPITNTIIKTFERIKEAGNELGVNYKTIHKVLDLPNRTAYGFKWISQ